MIYGFSFGIMSKHVQLLWHTEHKNLCKICNKLLCKAPALRIVDVNNGGMKIIPAIDVS